MGNARVATFALPMMLMVVAALTPVHAATQPSIPINGRYSALTIKIYIPLTPKWAHDVVLNAAVAWNEAQLWYLQESSGGTLYAFTETDEGTATSTVSFSMPAAFAPIAAGWTTYKFAPSSRTTIVSTQTYLTPVIFNDAQGKNATAERYASWLALHELGRILGLGSVLDGRDIMDPRYTPERVSEVPTLSTLDLYAVHVLAQGTSPTFLTLPDGVQDQFTPATVFLNSHQMAPTLDPTQPAATATQASQPNSAAQRYIRFFDASPL